MEQDTAPVKELIPPRSAMHSASQRLKQIRPIRWVSLSLTLYHQKKCRSNGITLAMRTF